MYYGGTRCGCVMIPASLNRYGWCVFQKELNKFLSGENTVSVVERTSNGIVDGGPMANGGQTSKKLINYGNQRKYGKFQNSRGILGYNGIKGDSAITISNNNGRPTCKFVFKLTFANLGLRVFKPDGGKRVVSWMGQVKPQKPIVVGHVVIQTQAHDQASAHLANPIENTHLEAVIYSDTNGLNERKFYIQGTGGLGENSSALKVAAESPTVVPVALIRAKLHSCPVAELPAPISVASHPNREFER